MSAEKTDWSYNEFLAFLMIYGAEMNYKLSQTEVDFIKAKTGVEDIDAIKRKVDRISDALALEQIDNFKKKYLTSPESRAKAKSDIEELLKSPGGHSQFEKVVIHLMEKLI